MTYHASAYMYDCNTVEFGVYDQAGNCVMDGYRFIEDAEKEAERLNAK